MTTCRKKPGVAFWTTVAMVVALLYPISFGPACWISSRIQPSGRIVSIIYRPVIRVWWETPDWADEEIFKILQYGTAHHYVRHDSRAVNFK